MIARGSDLEENFSVRQMVALAVMLTGTFVAVLDNFIVFIAIPSIRADLGAGDAQSEFVVAAYTLTYAVGMISGGRLGDRFGRRRLFLLGLAAFTASSVACGLASTPDTLILARIFQGFSSAILAPQVLAIIRHAFGEPSHRRVAFAWMGVVIGLASVLGQLLGGVLIAADVWGLSWRSVFFVNVPVGVLALATAPFVLEESRASRPGRLDMTGALLSALALGLLLYPLGEGDNKHWPAWCFEMMVASVVVSIGFLLHQRHKVSIGSEPLLDLRLFQSRPFSIGALMCLLFYATLGPLFLSFTYLFQIGYGWSPMGTAAAFAPLPIAFSVSSLVAGKLTAGRAHRVLVSGAAIALAASVSTWVVCTWAAFPPVYPLLACMVGFGVGQGLFMTPIMNAVLSDVDPEFAGVAGAVLITTQRVGNAFGIAVLSIPFLTIVGTMRPAGTGQAPVYVEAFRAVVAWIGVMLIGVLVLSRYLVGNDLRRKAVLTGGERSLSRRTWDKV